MTAPARAGRAIIATPVGRLAVVTVGAAIQRLDWLAPGPEEWPAAGPAREAATAVLAWFADPRNGLDLPLVPAATAFQARVRAALRAISVGATRTYGDLAAELGSSPRAIGGACRANPVPLVVPCHRVVARSGLGGYGGDWQRGAAISHKQRLLALERAAVGR